MTNEWKKSGFQKRLENLQVEAYRRDQAAKEMEMALADMGLGFVKMKKEKIFINAKNLSGKIRSFPESKKGG